MTKFKTGDRVRVTRTGSYGSNAQAGDEGVVHTFTVGAIYVQFPQANWWVERDDLELIDDPELAEADNDEPDVVEQLRNFGGEVVRTVVAAGTHVGTFGFVTKDSGQREEFATGSRRDSREGKGRYDLLPPEGLRRLAQLYERGAAKYGDRNWEKGQPVSRYLDSLLRHVFCYLEGEATEDHLAAAAWNALGAIVTEERTATGLLPAELNDLRGAA